MKISRILLISTLCMLFSSAYAAEVDFDRDLRTVNVSGEATEAVSVMLLKPNCELSGSMTNTEVKAAIENVCEGVPDGDSKYAAVMPIGDIGGSCKVYINGGNVSENLTVEVFTSLEVSTALSELSAAAGAGSNAKTQIAGVLADSTKCKILMADEIYAYEAFREQLYASLAEKTAYTSYAEVKVQLDKVAAQIDCLNGFNAMINKAQVRDLIEKLYTVVYPKDSYYTNYMSLAATDSVDQMIFAGKPYASLTDAYNALVTALTPSALPPAQSGGGSGGGGGGGSSSHSIVAGGAFASSGTGTQNTEKFTDVQASHWAKTYIYELVKKEIVSGVSENEFKPDENITREAFVKMIVSALMENVPASADSFTDTDKNAWYSKYIAAAAKMGLASGRDDGSFGVGELLSRQDMAVLIMRAAEFAGAELEENTNLTFADAESISGYARDSVSVLCNAGIISGMGDNCFVPDGNATRAQAARMVYELIKLTEGTI